MEMDAKQLASIIDGREEGHEITDDEIAIAKANSLLVVTGCSDDLIEMYGLFRDEVGAYGGAVFHVDCIGAQEAWDEFDKKGYEEAKEHFRREALPRIQITATWCRSESDPAWFIEADAPFETFMVMDDGTHWSRGIVIDCRHLTNSKECVAGD